MTTAEKVHENKMRKYAERQGLMLVKSSRRDPRAWDFGRFVLVPDTRKSPFDPRDPEVLAYAYRKLDRGEGLTMEQVEEALGYASAPV
jgi:hypothetical protein